MKASAASAADCSASLRPAAGSPMKVGAPSKRTKDTRLTSSGVPCSESPKSLPASGGTIVYDRYVVDDALSAINSALRQTPSSGISRSPMKSRGSPDESHEGRLIRMAMTCSSSLKLLLVALASCACLIWRRSASSSLSLAKSKA
eukprot:scaffold70229_cov65-Phaeocystis_antarctica.AAC.5